MEYTFDTVKDELSLLTEAITSAVPVEEIYLFGSYAYGRPSKDSDIDLYVVLKDNIGMRELDAMEKIWDAIYPVKKSPVDLLALKSGSFRNKKQYPTLERRIAQEGIRIYG
jgi:predicted nucleotidyltransferase